MKLLLKNGTLNLLVLLLLTFVLINITNRYILTSGFYSNGGDPLSGVPGQEVSIYENLQRWIYISSAAYLIVKLAAISLVLYTALYLADQQVTYKDIFNVVVLAEFVFLIPAVIKITSFYYVFPHGTLEDWRQYYILSTLSLFKYASPDWYYALQTVNVFEICYWFLLALGIYRISGLNYDKSVQIVVTAYLPALFIWVASVTFCTLMLFPASG
jgi:hypothetical protein